MGMRNRVTPNINIPAQRGWCLKYVDDGVNAPARKPNAKASFEQEQRNGNIRGDIAVGVWVPGYLSLGGAFADVWHVFWAYKHPDGRLEIHDSEVHSGHRAPYNSLAELLAWFGNYNPHFIGYTMGIDGIHIIEEFADPVPEPTPEPTPAPAPEPQPTPDRPFKVGDIVVPLRLVDYDGTPLKQWDDDYTITEVIGDRAVLEARGQVWAAMNVKDIAH